MKVSASGIEEGIDTQFRHQLRQIVAGKRGPLDTRARPRGRFRSAPAVGPVNAGEHLSHALAPRIVRHGGRVRQAVPASREPERHPGGGEDLPHDRQTGARGLMRRRHPFPSRGGVTHRALDAVAEWAAPPEYSE